MGTITRGIKNAFRNNLRSFSIVLILSIAIGMALVMLMSYRAVQNKIESVKNNIGNFITVAPAGIRGFEGGGSLLNSDDVSKISQIEAVTKTAKTLMDHLATDKTNLQAPTEAGNFGQRQRMQSGATNQTTNHAFVMPVMVSATDDLSVLSSLNVSKLDITSGEKFDATTEDNVALIGSSLATKNNLSVSSTFQAYGQDIKVVGVFDAGTEFSNAQAFMPLKTLQKLSGQNDQINSVVVQVSSIDKMSDVTANIEKALGDKADVTSSQDTSNQAIEPLENIKTISLYSLIGSLIAGAVILFLTMTMIVRERRREIGVLKAIGSSNAGIVTQFSSEALVLTLLGSAVGIILGAILSNPILNVLVSNNSSVPTPGAGGHSMMMRMGAGVAAGAQGTLQNLSANVGVDIILYGLGVAILIAIIGSAIPAFVISKVRPAEVLRSE